MADINLLPEEFREKDARAREKASQKSKKVELNLTSPEKTKTVTSKKGFFKKIFGGGVSMPSLPTGGADEGPLPAERKTPTPKPPQQHAVHLPDTRSVDTNTVAQPLTSTDETMSVPKKTPPPLVNKHMSEFQPPAESKEKKKPEMSMHTPTSSTGETKTTKVSKDTPEVSITETIQEEQTRGFTKILDVTRSLFYKMLRRNQSDRIMVNLMPEHKISFKDVNWGRIVKMLLVSIGGAATVTVLWYLILLDQERRDQEAFDELQSAIGALNVQIAQLEDDQKESLLLKNQLDLAGGLLDEHIYWTQFLDLLEDMTLDGVYFSGFSATIDEEGIIELSGSAVDLETIYWQRETFEDNDAVMAVVVTSAQPTSEGLAEFTIQLAINPEIWRR